MVSVNLKGGLGNQLFQISAGYTLARNTNRNFACTHEYLSRQHGGSAQYFKNVLRNVPFIDKLPKEILTYNEKTFHYTPLDNLEGNVFLDGYFQSEKYFKDFKVEIIELLSADDESLEYLKNHFNAIFTHENTCALHVRRGDYLRLQNYHPVQTVDYFKNAVDIMGDSCLYMVCSDDISWCEDNLNFIKNKIFIQNVPSYLAFYAASLCKNNIMSNSTFAWWAAYINQNLSKKIIAPKLWFGPGYADWSTKDIYCDNWITL
jgi:hypothetical protein